MTHHPRAIQSNLLLRLKYTLCFLLLCSSPLTCGDAGKLEKVRWQGSDIDTYLCGVLFPNRIPYWEQWHIHGVEIKHWLYFMVAKASCLLRILNMFPDLVWAIISNVSLHRTLRSSKENMRQFIRSSTVLVCHLNILLCITLKGQGRWLDIWEEIGKLSFFFFFFSKQLEKQCSLCGHAAC